MKSLSIVIVLFFSLSLTLISKSAATVFSDPEVGNVDWSRDFEKSLEESKKSWKPVFVLFQEVPGCHGCKKFGQTVLIDPLIVEAIESEFVPVLVYNNKGTKDAEILKRYKEPSWNFQVVRFLDGEGKDIIPRKDKVWTKEGIVNRMVEALDKAGRPVPQYLQGLKELNTENLTQAAFAMNCYWTGELHLGAIEGVVKTEAGWYEGREVTRVWYDTERLTTKSLIKKAAEVKCADKVYLLRGQSIKPEERLRYGSLVLSRYSKAKKSDQKKQIQGSEFLKLKLNEYQLTKINSFARGNKAQALSYLSPRQRDKLRKN